VPDVGDQLRAYGEALERALLEGSDGLASPPVRRPARRHGRRRVVLAAAAALLVAAAAWGLLAPERHGDDLRLQDGPSRPAPAGPDGGPAPSTTAAPPLRPSITTRDGGGAPGASPASPGPSPAGPATGGRPGPGTTGPTDPGVLRPVTAEEVEAMMRPGAVIEDVAITGGNLDVRASDVTIRNFTLDAAGAGFGVRSCGPDEDCGTPADQTTGLLLEDGEIFGTGVTAFWGREATLRRLDVHHSDNSAFRPLENVTIERSWWHDLAPDDGGSGNGVLFGAGGGRNVTIRANTCDQPVSVSPAYGGGACVIAGTGSTDVAVVVEGNWLTGGNNTVECNGHGSMTVVGNRFGRALRYRPVSRCPAAADNVWDDTGEPI
jgi:hypothetical protein